MESRRNGPQLSSRHDDDDDTLIPLVLLAYDFNVEFAFIAAGVL